MNPLVGGYGAPSSAAGSYASTSGPAVAAVLALVGLALLQGLIAGYLLRTDEPRLRAQLDALRTYLVAPLAAIGCAFVVVVVRYVWRVLA